MYSDRDKRILELLADGLTERQTTERFGIYQQVVHMRIKAIDERGFGEVFYAKNEADRKRGRLRDY
jgi:hypothetical protein